MAWDASFKNFLKHFLKAEVITELDVPSANLRLDFILKNRGGLPIPFSFGKETILGEFKSERDSFSSKQVHQGLGKAHIHLSSLPVKNRETVSLMFLIGGLPLTNDIIKEFHPTLLNPGIYHIDHFIHTLLVVMDELQFDENNSFLGLFASKPIRKAIIGKAIREDQRFIISYSYFLYKEEVLEVAESENLEVDPRSLSIQSAVDSIGLDRVIEEVGLDRVIEEIGKLTEKDGLKVLIDKMTPEQKKALKKLLDNS